MAIYIYIYIKIGNCGNDGYVHDLDCSDGFMDIPMYQNF